MSAVHGPIAPNQRGRRLHLLAAPLCCLVAGLAACSILRPAATAEEAYRLLQFDSEVGAFDPRLDAAAQHAYWQQWKRARRLNMLLNPDDAHGRQCGTHANLHAKGLLTSRFLPDFAFFLVRPGRRPCDHDETCTSVTSSEPVTCAHTQFVLDYPVVVGPRGGPYRDYRMDRDFFNAMVQSRGVRVRSAAEAEQVARLYLFLTTLGSRQTPTDIEAVEARAEGEDFRVRARLRTVVPPESVTQSFAVAADGSIVPLTTP